MANLRVLILGVEGKLLVQHFSNYDKDQDLDFENIEDFGSEKELCPEVDAVSDESIYDFIQNKLEEMKNNGETVEEEYEYQLEEYGPLIIDESTKNDYFAVIALVGSEDGDEDVEQFKQFVISELELAGLKFERLEEITSPEEDEFEENKYLWQHLMIDGIDLFY